MDWPSLTAAGVGGVIALAAVVLILRSRRQDLRAEARRTLDVLRSTDALLHDELEPLLDEEEALFNAVSISRPGAVLPLDKVATLRSRTAELRRHIVAEAEAQRAILQAAGLDLRRTLEAIGHADDAMQEFFSVAARTTDPGSEPFHAHARWASAAVAETALQVRQVRAQIDDRKSALAALAR